MATPTTNLVLGGETERLVDVATRRCRVKHRRHSMGLDTGDAVSEQLGRNPLTSEGRVHEHHADPSEASIWKDETGGNGPPVLIANAECLAEAEHHRPVCLGLVPSCRDNQ